MAKLKFEFGRLVVKISRIIHDALASGSYGDIYYLVSQWGIWSRGGCPQGYFKGNREQEILILDDESALVLDKAVMCLKLQNRKLYKILFRFFVLGLDCDDIVVLMSKDKTKKLTDYGSVTTAYDRDVVAILVKQGVYKVWNELVKVVDNEELCV